MFYYMSRACRLATIASLQTHNVMNTYYYIKPTFLLRVYYVVCLPGCWYFGILSTLQNRCNLFEARVPVDEIPVSNE